MRQSFNEEYSEANGVVYDKVTLSTFYTRDTVDGIIAEVDIVGKNQIRKFLGLHQEFKDVALYIVFANESIDSVTIPGIYISYVVRKHYLRVKLEFPMAYQAVVEDTLSLLMGDVLFSIQFCIGKDEVPPTTRKVRHTELKAIHGLFRSLASYEEITAEEYKLKYKTHAGIQTLSELSQHALQTIRRTLQDTLDNLVGIDEYKRVFPNCAVCGKPETDVHHIIYRSQETDPDELNKFHNLISLCREHHNEFHKDPKSFQDRYSLAKVSKKRPELR